MSTATSLILFFCFPVRTSGAPGGFHRKTEKAEKAEKHKGKAEKIQPVADKAEKAHRNEEKKDSKVATDIFCFF